MCSTVEFSAEQIREVRRRIASSASVDEALSMFKLPKVTRLRTFRAMMDTYRVNGDTVEYLAPDGKTWRKAEVGQPLSWFAECLARWGKWDDLATFADICAHPTEEVPDDGR